MFKMSGETKRGLLIWRTSRQAIARSPILNCVSARRTGGRFQSQYNPAAVMAQREPGMNASGALNPHRAQINAPARAAQPMRGYNREGRYVSTMVGSMLPGYSHPLAPSIALFQS